MGHQMYCVTNVPLLNVPADEFMTVIQLMNNNRPIHRSHHFEMRLLAKLI